MKHTSFKHKQNANLVAAIIAAIFATAQKPDADGLTDQQRKIQELFVNDESFGCSTVQVAKLVEAVTGFLPRVTRKAASPFKIVVRHANSSNEYWMLVLTDTGYGVVTSNGHYKRTEGNDPVLDPAKLGDALRQLKKTKFFNDVAAWYASTIGVDHLTTLDKALADVDFEPVDTLDEALARIPAEPVAAAPAPVQI